MKRLILASFFIALFTAQVNAQVQNCKVTTSAPSYVSGQTSPLSCDTAGNLRASTAAPVGGATAALQTTGNATLASILSAMGTPSGGNASQTTLAAILTALGSPYQAGGALPLPSGAATQTTLASILSALGSPLQAGGSLAANQSVNEAQINGVTPLMGAGQTGTGAQRVTQSQDSISAPINISTATTTQLIALSGSTKIYITSFDVIAGGTGNFQLVYGTGSNCGTGQNPLTGAYNLTAQAGIAKGNGAGAILVTPAGQAVCAITSAGVQMSGSISSQQF